MMKIAQILHLTTHFGRYCVGCRLFSRAVISSVQKDAHDPVNVLANKDLSYQEVFYTLYQQARNSILFHVNTDPGINQRHLEEEIHKFCTRFGSVIYLVGVTNSPNYFLAEFSSEDAIQNVSDSCSEGALNTRLAHLSPSGLNLNWKADEKAEDPNINQLHEQLINASDVSDQMIMLTEARRATSAQVREKLFLPSLFQDFFNRHMKTDYSAVPFGTTVFGYSSPTSDMDITLTHISSAHNYSHSYGVTTTRHLGYKAAQQYNELHRAGTNSLFSEACKYLSKHLPGVTDLTSFDAMYPLIKMHYAPFHVGVDVSLDNKVGVQTAWLFNIYARADSRVAPFLFFVKEWATHCGLLGHGGPRYEGITPFMMSCIALFYLMRIHPPVIPPIKEVLVQKPSNRDFIIAGFRTKMKGNISDFECRNTDNLEDLFLGFLQYYSKFDFGQLGLNLLSGKTLPSFGSGLHVRLPLMSTNVGKACTVSSMNKFNRMIIVTLRKLETSRTKKTNDWGILSFFDLKSRK